VIPVRVDLPPPDPSLHTVGGEDGGQRGEKQVTLLTHFGLTPTTRLLEIGCGVGRLAYELADYLVDGGSYTGFDISETAIAWLNDHYAPRLPNFRFDHLDVHNPRFNPDGNHQPASERFPYADASFDFVCAFEVFMHMERAGVERYLGEIDRVLVPGGRAVVTFMAILDDAAPGGIGGRPFVAVGDGVYTRLPDRQGWSLGYHDRLIREMLGAAGLRLDDTVEGQWHHPFGRAAVEGAPWHGCDVYVVSARTGT
jgi:SAM-dependent methyltransferase